LADSRRLRNASGSEWRRGGDQQAEHVRVPGASKDHVPLVPRNAVNSLDARVGGITDV
jgi:hypothetical protein